MTIMTWRDATYMYVPLPVYAFSSYKACQRKPLGKVPVLYSDTYLLVIISFINFIAAVQNTRHSEPTVQPVLRDLRTSEPPNIRMDEVQVFPDWDAVLPNIGRPCRELRVQKPTSRTCMVSASGERPCDYKICHEWNIYWFRLGLGSSIKQSREINSRWFSKYCIVASLAIQHNTISNISELWGCSETCPTCASWFVFNVPTTKE